MNLINKEIQNYIQCIKTLWNEYYRLLPDGEHDFPDVQRLIWKTLVTKLLQESFQDVSDGEIVIRPKHKLTSILVAIESPTGEDVSWQQAKHSIEEELMIFEDFFDFRNWHDPREFQYVECW